MYKVEERSERRTVSRSPGNYLAGLSRKMILPVLIGLAALTARGQLVAPSNDDFANAKPLTGISGTTRGTMIGATAETNEPPHNFSAAANSIWYVWTAPDYSWYTFNTRGSTDPLGNDLNTVLAIYTGSDLSTLTPSFTASANTGDPNDDDPSGGVTSRVTFQGIPGQTYYIAVDSSAGAVPGNVVLSWSAAPSAGTFQFASSIVRGQMVYAPPGNGNYPGVGVAMNPSFPDAPNNSGSRSVAGGWPAQMTFLAGNKDIYNRLTVTRSGPSRGRCSVDVMIDSTVYTNTYTTNKVGTNVLIFTTTVDDPNLATFDPTNLTYADLTNDANVVSFTNLLQTNICVTNQFQDNLYGNLFYNTNLFAYDVNLQVTNTGTGALQRTAKPVFDRTCTGPLSNVCTGLSFASGAPVVTNGLITFFYTNVFCTNYTTNVMIDSVTGGPPGDFALFCSTNGYSQVITVWFDDKQMSVDIPGAQNPWQSDLSGSLNLANFGEFAPGGLGYTNIDALTPFGALDPLTGQFVNPKNGFNLNLIRGDGPDDRRENFNYPGVNRTYILSLQNAQLDPQESQEVAPPQIDFTYGTAGWNVVSVDHTTPRPQTYQCEPETVFNFAQTGTSRYTIRQNPHDGGNTVLIVGVNRGGSPKGAASVSIRMNWLSTDCPLGHNNMFPISAGSEYAAPSGTNADISNSLDMGTVSWGDGDMAPKRVSVTVDPVANNRMQFNEDVRLQLFGPSGSVPAFLGNVPEANVTILFNDEPYSQQPAGAVDRTHNRDLSTNSYPPFNQVPGADKTVYSIGIQSDGSSIIAGDFTSYDADPYNRIVRVDTNGFPDFSFDPGDGANDFIATVAVDGSNRILIGGGFTSFNGRNRYHVARLNANGSIDNSFHTGFGANGTVWALAQQPDGKILIGGEFTSYDATNRNYIARLNTDGSLDTSFNPPTGPNDTVFAIAVDGNGKILIGGQFTSVNGLARGHLARLNADGSVDGGFNTGVGLDDNVYAIAVQADGQILVGGSFTQYNLISQNGLVRLNTNGTPDNTFSIGYGVDGTVYSIATLPNTNTLIGGDFTTYDTVSRGAVARLLPDGALDTSFLDTAYNQFAGLPNHYFSSSATNGPDVDPNYQFNTRNVVFSIVPENYGNTNVMIGGGFARVGGGFRRDDVRNRLNVARLVGGSTPGPGNIYLNRSTYNVNENAAKLLVDVTRTNGQLGGVIFFFTTNTLGTGPGLASSSDFGIIANAASTGGQGAIYPSYYLLTAGQHPCSSILCPTGDNYGWMQGDAYYGPSQNAIPECPASTGAQLYLGINDNSLVDGNRVANLQLASLDGNRTFQLGGQYIPLGVAFGRQSATLNIVDNDYYAGTFGFSSPTYSVNRNGSSITVNVVRTNASNGTVILNFTTANGTAFNSIDYVKTNGTLTFGPGVTSRPITIRILNSFTAQPDKYFNIQLGFNSNPGNYAQFDTNVLATNAVVNIIDNNFSPGHLNFTSPTFAAGETAGLAKISVMRTGGSVGAISAQYFATAGTGTNNLNFIATNGTLTWNNNDTSTKTFFVPLIHDGIVTGDLTVNLSLTNAVIVADPTNPSKTNILGLLSNAVLTVVDEDAAGRIGFITPNFNVNEDAQVVHVTVARAGGVAGSASIGYTTTNLGPATNAIFAQALTNYSPASGILNFAPGELTKSFDVLLIDNGFQNPDKIFGVALFNPNPSSVTNSALTLATVTIIDNETQHTPPGQVDTTYTSPGFNDFVLATALQRDGKLVAGGNFTLVNNFTRNRVARLNVDGTVDTAFGGSYTGVNGSVRAVLAQSPNPDLIHTNNYTNGPIVIAGAFDIVNNVFRHKIARLNSDGGLDSTFNPGSGADGVIYALAETFAGANQYRKVLVGGAFASFNGNAANGLVQLNDDGTIDNTFNAGVVGANGIDGIIYAVAVQGDGKIVIGGDFTSYNGTPHGHIARLNKDGSLDNTFNPDTGTNGSVRAIAIQPDGYIVIGGLFTNVNGTAFNHIARLRANGTIDPQFNVGLGANDSVLALAVDSQARIYVGGEFTQASGVTRYRLTRLASDGTVDPSINFGAGADNFIQTIALQTDDQIIVGGGFTNFDNVAVGHIARLAGGSMRGDGQITFTSAEYVVNENGTNAVITLRRIGGTESSSSPASSVDFITQDGSALAGTDYIGVTNTIVFPRGETFETILVPIIDNLIVDGDRFLELLLLNPANGLALGPQPFANLTIVNDDSGVAFGAAQFRVAENAPAGAALIPLIREGSTAGTLTVDVATTGGTAIPLINYVPATNTIVFNPGESNKTFRVQVLNDNQVDGDQTVGLQLSNPQNGFLVSPNIATLTIAESSFGAGILSFSDTNYSVLESSGVAYVTIQRTNGSTGPVSVTLTTANGTATAGQDYAPTNVNVSLADGEISKTVGIGIVSHTNVQPDKAFTVSLSNPKGGATIGANNPATINILDDHVNFTFGSPVYFVHQNDGFVVVSVIRHSGTNGTVSVDYSTTNSLPTNGVAVAGEDYTTTGGTLVFNPGEVSKAIFIPILDDGNVGIDEHFNVVLSNPGPNSFLGAPSVTDVTILNVHSGFGFSSPTYVIGEGQTNAVITVTRSAINTGNVSVNFTTVDGSARAGIRYIATNGVLNFINGQATASFTVPIIDNGVVDGDQSLQFRLFGPSAGTVLVQSNAVLTIQDNDIGVSFSSASYRVAKNGGSIVIPVLRTGPTNSAVSVDYNTKDGTALSPINYLGTNGSVTFAPGQTVTNIVVSIQDNNIITGDKTFSVNLLNPTGNGILITPSAATVTIVEVNGSLVVPAGMALLNESGPVNGLLDPNETVTMYFAFRNTGGGDTTNLVATLLNTNGVTNATAAIPYNGVNNSASYGHLNENGASASQQFTFKVAATNDQPMAITFKLEDVVGANRRQLGTGLFTLTAGSHTLTYSNNASITILDSTNPPTKASFYPSKITVPTTNATIAKATVTFVGLGHTYPDDIDALLVGPGNTAPPSTLLMAAVGGRFGFNNLRLTFDDSYPALSDEQQISSGTNRPTLGTAASEPYFYPTFPALGVTPAPPGGPYQVSMSVFKGINPSGDWNLYIVDSTTLDNGVMSGGWILNLTLGSNIEQAADLGVAITSTPAPATVSNVVMFHVDFTNYGPATATNIVVSNFLPAGLTYLSNDCGCTMTVATNGALLFPLATLGKDQRATFDFFVRGDVLGTFSNTIAIHSDNPDHNSNNDSATALVEVDTPSADMAANISLSPNPVLINNNVTITMTAINNGFSPAIGVLLTNQLPAGLSLVSVSSSLGSAVITTNTTGLVVASLGDLAVNASPTVTIVATATNQVTSLVSARVGSSTFDPLKGNNTASAKIEIDGPPLNVSVQNNGLLLSWPSSAGNLVVEQTTSLAPPAVWTVVTNGTVTVVNGQYQVQVSASNAVRFFRLRAQ